MTTDSTARPVPWIPPVLYAAVLAGGLYHAAVAEEAAHPGRVAGFVAGLALLLTLELLERGRQLASAAVLLTVRLLLFSAVAALDGSGVSRALFVLVPFSAYFAFGRRVALLTGAGCVALLLTGYGLWVPHWWLRSAYVSDLLMFALALALALSMAAVAVGEQQGRARLERALAELERYAAQVAELSTAEERNRVAREIHDSLGHHLTAVAVQLEKAEVFRELDPAAAARAVSDARWSAGRALTEVRESVSALREVRPFSLSRALTDLVRHLGDDRLTVSLDLTGDELTYESRTLTALYRAAQEALTNARRHGRATRVQVAAEYGENSARLVVTDNGAGFTVASADPGSGSGLRGMRERVAALGGLVEVRDRPADGPTGVVVTVTVPRVRRAAELVR
ncbi:signal transduction histidine kinase [Kitasatospora gansuensis]|uniref:Signal transduction histidine kinase n=1 Tax=Kitasatospora gansuensis TaxID=258050 RepID=A0A7W7S8D7_9ACTN|nr:sensor histidine kinase [Kitasatospora gansuensis]MBB4945203.1 signal transduction histidine kinase [Kitasatospora gansuensis]